MVVVENWAILNMEMHIISISDQQLRRKLMKTYINKAKGLKVIHRVNSSIIDANGWYKIKTSQFGVKVQNY